MSNTPLDLQRRFEQQWAARFLRWHWPRPKSTGMQSGIKPILAKTKRKTRRIKAAGLRSAPAL
jgi:hypothetical protein